MGTEIALPPSRQKKSKHNTSKLFYSMIILENEILKAVISEKGAELQSLFNKENGIEYMWRGDAAFGANTVPYCFLL